ncbi:MAG: hypothetical protein GC131_06270 [Alphaproteobacteria bacterium]|nr:hypothetical protein [Alphaproteobacteria bacterium]
MAAHINPSVKIPSRQKKAEPLPTAHLIETIDALVDVLDAEPALLAKRALEDHKDLLHRKQQLMLDYNADLKALAQTPATFAALPDKARTQLTEANSKLSGAVQRNQMALKVALTATERLVQSIIKTVRDEAQPKQSYANLQHQGGVAYKASIKPVAFNHTV